MPFLEKEINQSLKELEEEKRIEIERVTSKIKGKAIRENDLVHFKLK